MNSIKYLLLAVLLGSASMQAMACYTVYDSSSRIVYRGERAPVDMSRPLHETLSARVPGGHMVFDTESACPELIASAPSPALRAGTPLLTNARTAQAMRLPYTRLAGGIALVPQGDAHVGPGFTVLPSDPVATAAAAGATRAMGAGAAPRR